MSVYAKNKTPRAAMGCETTRRRCQPKDNLALDAMDARAAGMTYGKWKAMHPETKKANESRLPQHRKKEYDISKVYECTCLYCGKKFVTDSKQRRYCTDLCKAKNDKERYLARHQKKTAEGEE